MSRASAQISDTIFQDDFSANTIDPSKYQPDAPFFEGGLGDIHAIAGNGVMQFVGTTTQQWWSGATLRLVPTFTATEQANVAVSIDRIAEAGVGSASRSALWILDETRTRYVLFADVRGEGGWRYNRKINETGDVPTGSGTDIAVFNGGTFDDGGLHRMRMVADGQTVKLFLDGQLGAEVRFPFSKVVIEFGSYARANNDTADTTWDNLRIETLRQCNVVFSDDFSANTIDPSKYEPDAPFFEGGLGTIHAEAGNGVIHFVGSTTQQWWSGATLRVVPTFAASDEATIALSIDRVAEAGVGSASRSALWILDQTRTRYVLFADVRGEGGWRYNRKINETGDVPTGSGTDIAVFNGASFDDGGLHRMSMVHDGRTVKLLLDGELGVEVRFPFSPVIFEFGSYARANNDTADTTWDNLDICSSGAAGFDPNALSVRVGGNRAAMVRIPEGLNAQNAVHVRVASSDANVALPEGGTGGTLDLTFPAGGANTASFQVRGVGLGCAEFNASGDVGSLTPLVVAVVSGPGVQLDDNFAGTVIDGTRWQTSNVPFETGMGEFTVQLNFDEQFEISGAVATDFWPGASLKTASNYVASKDLLLSFEVDRVAIDQIGSAARTGVFITTADRSRFVFFGQDVGENNWQVNVNPGNPTGTGTRLTTFDDIIDNGTHRLKLVADGDEVEVFLDGRSGGRFPFAATCGIYFEVGAYARSVSDTVRGVFDNVKIENTLPCITLEPQAVTITAIERSRQATVTIPALLNDVATAMVSITSRDPLVAFPDGATNGTLVLNFAAGAPGGQTFTIIPGNPGTTTFDIISSPQACVIGLLTVDVVEVPLDLLTDDFSDPEFDPAKWRLDPTPFESGTFTADSAITLTNGQARISVTAESSTWPGLALFTVVDFFDFAVAPTTPLSFEIDRTRLDFVLTTGTSAEQRTGIWVKNGTGNFVFFDDHVAHDGDNFGWRYNRLIGQEGDNPTDNGVNIPAFDGARFNDQGNHRMKMVVNGSTVKLFLDDVFGAEVPFPFTDGLIFGFGAYVRAATDVVRGFFDNARITGGAAPRLRIVRQGANAVITWTGAGVLQSSPSLLPANWTDVTPAPVGNSLTVSLAEGAMRVYRLRP